jgi:hypothetical protein
MVFPGAPFHPVVQKLPIGANSPHCRSSHFYRPPIGRKSKYAVIATANAPPRGHTSPISVLKTRDNLELKPCDSRLKIAYPLHESGP